jgi:hypothetical protein
MNDINIFIKHPEEVGMTYSQHMRFALMLFRKTFAASMASFVHAFFPFLFTTTASNTVFELYGILKFRLKEECKDLEHIPHEQKTASF